MFPFEIFAFPQVWINAAPELWQVLTTILIVIAAVFAVIGFGILLVAGLRSKYDQGIARVGFGLLATAIVFAAFGPWLWVLTAALLLLWLLWRVVLRNAWVAVFGNKKKEDSPSS